MRHEPREKIEAQLAEQIWNRTDPTIGLLELQTHILLDIRDLLDKMSRNSNVPKWGPKI